MTPRGFSTDFFVLSGFNFPTELSPRIRLGPDRTQSGVIEFAHNYGWFKVRIGVMVRIRISVRVRVMVRVL